MSPSSDSTAEAVATHLAKGRKVVVEGRLQFRTWETEMGQKRSKLEVVAERVNFMPQGNQNGNGDVKAAGAPKQASQEVMARRDEEIGGLPTGLPSVSCDPEMPP